MYIKDATIWVQTQIYMLLISVKILKPRNLEIKIVLSMFETEL